MIPLRSLPVILAFALLSPAIAPAQTLGQFTGAGAGPEGEGAVFMLAGNEAFRAGLAARFNISRMSDFGVQLGVDRACEESSFGGGIDFKLVLLERTEKLPAGLALDLSFGSLNSDAMGRFCFGFGILTSGYVPIASGREIEPYLSFIVAVEQIDRKDMDQVKAACLCPVNDDETVTDTLVRAGIRVPVSHDTHVLIEAGFDDTPLFGAAFNIVF